MSLRGFLLTDQNGSEYLTLDEAAGEFGVSRRTLERLRQQGLLPGVRVGRYLRVRRDDVRRALTYSDPIPLYRELLGANSEVLVEEWMRGWVQLTVRSQGNDGARDAKRRWADEASRRYGTWPVTDYQVRHAIDAAEAARVDGPVEVLVMAMRGMPEDRAVVDVLREIVPLLNPMINL